MTPSLELALVYGSSREGRLCDTVAAWAADTIGELSDFAVDHVDPLALGLPSWHEAQRWPPCSAGSIRPTRLWS
jgi:NAD(P)H-dependent FMN reductase